MATDLITSPDEQALLVRVLRVAYPHDRFPDGPYQRTAAAVVQAAQASPAATLSLRQGLRELAAAGFVDLDEAAATGVLRTMDTSAFFTLIKGTAVVALYDDNEVWGLLGYEGSSFEKGGYVDRGFDDLDWLPDPRIAEYEGETVR